MTLPPGDDFQALDSVAEQLDAMSAVSHVPGLGSSASALFRVAFERDPDTLPRSGRLQNRLQFLAEELAGRGGQATPSAERIIALLGSAGALALLWIDHVHVLLWLAHKFERLQPNAPGEWRAHEVARSALGLFGNPRRSGQGELERAVAHMAITDRLVSLPTPDGLAGFVDLCALRLDELLARAPASPSLSILMGGKSGAEDAPARLVAARGDLLALVEAPRDRKALKALLDAEPGTGVVDEQVCPSQAVGAIKKKIEPVGWTVLSGKLHGGPKGYRLGHQPPDGNSAR